MGFKQKRLPGNLNEAEIPSDPITLMKQWLKDAETTVLREPSAVALATSSRDGKPSMRMVLLKDLNEAGFVFFTNYESRKGRELDSNPNASLLFYWDALIRQVRVEGTVRKVSREESDAYFRSRPRMSRIGAWASRQSSVISGRSELEAAVEKYQREFSGEDVPLPPFWGGYRLVPSVMEFWQGRENRLHDRIRFTRTADGWTIDRLAP